MGQFSRQLADAIKEYPLTTAGAILVPLAQHIVYVSVPDPDVIPLESYSPLGQALYYSVAFPLYAFFGGLMGWSADDIRRDRREKRVRRAELPDVDFTLIRDMKAELVEDDRVS